MYGRLAFGFLLCLGSANANAEGGLSDILDWLEKHGPEAVSTVKHCAAAVGSGKSLMQKCPTHSFDPEGMAGLAAWGALEGLEQLHSPLAKELANSSLAHSIKERAISMVQKMTHHSLGDFCARSDCLTTLGDFDASYVKCYAAALCATAMGGKIPYDHCKSTFESFLTQNMRLHEGMMCRKEKMTDYFCAEESTRLLLESPRCYVRFVSPAEVSSCTPECVAKWKDAVASHPVCSAFVERQTSASLRMTLHFMRELVRESMDPAARKELDYLPKHVTSFQQMCALSSFVQVPRLMV